MTSPEKPLGREIEARRRREGSQSGLVLGAGCWVPS